MPQRAHAMKIWPWGANPDYAINVDQGTKGKWRWSLVFPRRHRGALAREGLGDRRRRADGLP